MPRPCNALRQEPPPCRPKHKTRKLKLVHKRRCKGSAIQRQTQARGKVAQGPLCAPTSTPTRTRTAEIRKQNGLVPDARESKPLERSAEETWSQDRRARGFRESGWGAGHSRFTGRAGWQRQTLLHSRTDDRQNPNQTPRSPNEEKPSEEQRGDDEIRA